VADDYEAVMAAAVGPLLATLDGFEQVQRRLHPPELPALRASMKPVGQRLASGLDGIAAASPPEALRGFNDQLLAGGRSLAEAFDLFCSEASAEQGIMQVLASMGALTRSLEQLYPLRTFSPLGRFFIEPAFHDRLDELDPEPREGVATGVHLGGDANDRKARGGFALYVPEWWDGSAEMPLVVALHGGSGDGRGFMWSWLREARGRGFFLLAPTAQGSTWSMMGEDIDGPALRAMVELVAERWPVKRSSILLTGLSDGATYSLLTGLAEDSPFTAFAPMSGVLHPGNLERGNMQRAAGRRIYLVHGALDWMFPVETARWAAGQLREAGADLVYREIDDLSHTYARDENDRILTWFDASLALPGDGEKNKGGNET